MREITLDDFKKCSKYIGLANDLSESIDRLRESMYKVTSYPKEVPIYGNEQNDRMANGFASLEPLEDKWREQIVSYVNLAVAVEEKISSLENPDHQRILRKKYLDGMTWEEVADRANYSRSRCEQLHDEALIILGFKKTR